MSDLIGKLPPAGIAGATFVVIARFGGAMGVVGHVTTGADAFGSRAELERAALPSGG